MKRLISTVTSAIMAFSAVSAVMPVSAAAEGDGTGRQVEYLTRGLTAVKTDGGVFLSWRLLGTEPLTQTYDIYKNGELYQSGIDAVNYTDTDGFSYDTYQVVPSGTAADAVDSNCEVTTVWTDNYYDIPLNKPAAGIISQTGASYTYSVNDASVADLDGDGELEYIIKWDPSNSQDNSQRGFTGKVYIDAYEFDGTQLWRIDLGQNIRAGAHYTQFIVYDFDGDGKAEMAVKTAPGTMDGQGVYVNEAVGFTGTYDDNDNSYVVTRSGSSQGMVISGEEYLTMFDGETGAALNTIDYPIERGSVSSWGDSYGGRSERYLAGVAYLNGMTPSLIECRGYYEKASMAALDWNRETGFELLWSRIDTWERDGDGNWGTYLTDETGTKTRIARETSIYAQGNHNLSICDADNDGRDEIVFGSAVVDDTGEGLEASTQHGHGDALHVTDFNNDGEQEVFQVHEDKGIAEDYGAEYRKAGTGEVLAAYGRRADVGRGVMGNIDDEYASQNPNALSMFWCSASSNLFDLNGDTVKNTITADGSSTEVEVAAPADTNFLIYWDGDLSRELLDRTRIDKFTVENGTERLETFSDVHSNNGSKATPAICADLFGDWREEVAFGTSDDTALRIFTTTDPTEYKLTTLMHDTQYRTAVAWQNVGYNQPAHLSYYVGSASLKAGANYLEPAAGFDTVYYVSEPQLNTEKESSENVIYTANSFNRGNSEGFTNVTVTTQNAPYNNVARVTRDSELDMRYLFDDNVTPPPIKTPEPPKATATPTYAQDFEDADEGVILAFGNPDNPVTNESYEGLKFYLGGRKDGDGTTNISIVADGNPGNAVAMRSGRFSDGGRAPRVELITPNAEPNNEIIAVMSVKAEAGNALYYNDSTTTQAAALLCDGDEDWHTLTISIVFDSSGNAVRTFYIDDEQAASDTAKTLPVLWAAGANVNTSVLIDNYSVRVEELEVEATPTPEASTPTPAAPTATASVTETPAPTADPENCVKIVAIYNEDGTLGSIDITENATAEEETPDAFTKVFYWSDMENMIPIAMYSGSFEPEAEVLEAEIPEQEEPEVTNPEEKQVKTDAETDDTENIEEIEQAETDGTAEAISNAKEDVNTDTIAAVDAAYEDLSGFETYAVDVNGTYKITFDWRPGSTVEFTDQNGANIVKFIKNDGEALKYKAGDGEETVIHAGLNSQSSWYHIELIVDLEAKTVDISAMDYTNNSETRSVYAVSFAGTDGYIASMKIGSGAYIDNIRVSEIEYLVPMTLYNFNVKNSADEPLVDAAVRIGSSSITTDANGHAAIKLKNDDYSYSVTKARYKSSSGELAANAEETEKTTDIILSDGEERDVYVNYMFGDVNLLDTGEENAETSEKIGTAYENTQYDVPDSIKLKEITYTFPSDEEDIVPGYEDYAGQTYTFVYDADTSTTNGIIIGEGADTYIDLGFKIKRTPTDTDTEVLDINFSEDGYESVESSWSTNIEPEYATDETYGTKYVLISGLNTNKLTVNIPEYTSDNLVIEFDISFKELSWGGNYYGVTPYSGTTAGEGFGLRTSGESNTQWQWCYYNENYMANNVGSGDAAKGYTYSYNWKDRWAHVVMAAVPSQNKFSVSVVNKDSGVVYLQDAELPFANGVGGAGNHITSLQFGLVRGSASARDSIGIANLKAYTVGTPNTVTEENIDIYPGGSVDISSSYHISDYEGLDYSLTGMFDVSYVFESAPGTEVTPSKMSVNNGVFTVEADATDEPAYVAFKYGDTVVKRYKLNWLARTLQYGTIKSFEGGETSPFTLTSKSGYHLTSSNGELLYSRDAGTQFDNNVWLNADIWTGELANEPVFSFDYRVESAQYKGYLILRDNNGTELVRIETHVYQPRMKIFQFPSDGSSNIDFRDNTGFNIGDTYTFVFKGNNYTSSNRTITLYIYKKGDYDYRTDTATGEPVMEPITITPNSGSANNGLRFAYEVAQNTGSSGADNGDAQYFDNFAYYYYKYE